MPHPRLRTNLLIESIHKWIQWLNTIPSSISCWNLYHELTWLEGKCSSCLQGGLWALLQAHRFASFHICHNIFFSSFSNFASPLSVFRFLRKHLKLCLYHFPDQTQPNIYNTHIWYSKVKSSSIRLFSLDNKAKTLFLRSRRAGPTRQLTILQSVSQLHSLNQD